MIVELTYFRQGGKYYSSGSISVDRGLSLYQIWDYIENLAYGRKLPDLIEGHYEFIVLINVPGHEHDHPRLLIPPYEQR